MALWASWKTTDWSHKSRLSKIELRVITDDGNSLDRHPYTVYILARNQVPAAGVCGGGSYYTATFYTASPYAFVLLATQPTASALIESVSVGETFVVRIK